jgi:HK97 family phage major capsid protein
MRVAEELINDIPGLTAFLAQQGTQDLYDVEDAQLLFGDGTSGAVTGVTDGALVTAAASNPLTDLVDGAQIVDAIVSGIAQLATFEYVADGVLLNPAQYFQILTLKGTDAHYIRPDLTIEGGMAFVAGVPVFMSTAMTAGSMCIGNWSRGAQLMQREGVSVRFYDQDQDNAIKNLVTIVLEERIALPIYYPHMFTFDAISDVTTAIETP